MILSLDLVWKGRRPFAGLKLCSPSQLAPEEQSIHLLRFRHTVPAAVVRCTIPFEEPEISIGLSHAAAWSSDTEVTADI